MRILIGFLVGALLIGALVWSGWEFDHPIWGPWQPQQTEAETVWVGCNDRLFEVPKPAQGYYECENGLPALVTPIRHMPAGQPTATPTATDVQSSANSSCPTTAEVKDLTGVDVQRLGTESCAWVWRGAPGVTTTAICPSGYVCTFDVVNDIVVVHLGVNQTATIRGGTWRFIDGYPSNDAVHNVCELYHNEKAFGLSEVPSFEVRFQAAYDGSGALVGPATCP